MLEELNKKNTVRESLESLVYLVGENPIRSLLYLGAIPFAALWIAHNSFWRGFALQLYFITTFVFAYYPFRKEKEDAKKWWYWKAMLVGGILIHPALMLALWNLDGAHPDLVTGAGGLFGITFLVAVLESIMIGSIVNRYRPKYQETGDSSPK